MGKKIDVFHWGDFTLLTYFSRSSIHSPSYNLWLGAGFFTRKFLWGIGVQGEVGTLPSRPPVSPDVSYVTGLTKGFFTSIIPPISGPYFWIFLVGEKGEGEPTALCRVGTLTKGTWRIKFMNKKSEEINKTRQHLKSAFLCRSQRTETSKTCF